MRRIIDVHVHLYPPQRLGSLMRWVHRGIPGHPVPADIMAPEAVDDPRAAGVERFFSAVFPLAPGEARERNRFDAALSRAIPEMIPLGTVHQDDEDPAGIAEEARNVLSLKGIKLHPMVMGASPADPRLAPVLSLDVPLAGGITRAFGRMRREDPIRERPDAARQDGIGLEYVFTERQLRKETADG